MAVLHSFSIKKKNYHKMDLRLFCLRKIRSERRFNVTFGEYYGKGFRNISHSHQNIFLKPVVG